MKNNAILDFFKSEHFMQRQWETGLDDYQLRRILMCVSSKQNHETLVIVTPTFLNEHIAQEKDCIVLVIRKNRLVTVYRNSCKNRIFKKQKDSLLQILY